VTAAVTISHLTKSFQSNDKGDLIVLKDVSFEVEPNEFVCILGPSGCGKSTILNILSGLETPSSGDATFFDGDPSRQSSIGYIFQEPRLLPWQTVSDNIRFVLKHLPLPEQEKSARIQEALQQVGLTEFAQSYPYQLSGGMQARVAIARALAKDPDLLLMDEPFSSLDEITARRLRAELIGTWSRNKKTVLFVTHDIAEASFLADKIVIYTPKPTRIARILKVDLPRPRSYGSTEVQDVERMVLNAFEASLAGYTAGEPV
jgi:ABC-type nitrate/sulfonate/bicarbonate transport system ATPase subunit